MLLVGFVRSRHYPKGVVSARGLWFQLTGILLLAYHFVPARWLPPVMQEWDLIFAWVLAFALSEVTVRLLLWRRRFTPAPQMQDLPEDAASSAPQMHDRPTAQRRSGLPLCVSHWPARLVGIVCAIGFTLFAVVGALARWPVGSIVFVLLALASVLLILLYGRTVISEQGITHIAPLGRFGMAWDEITAVVVDKGGNTIVFKGEDKQLVLPGVMLWAGRDKAAAEKLMEVETARRGIKPMIDFVPFAFSKGARLR
jgi:hypothetical protein